ncbi:MAG: DUF1015 domain-containing protein [Ktedonobacterales bacterium]
MADVKTLPGIRYAASADGAPPDLARLVTPPYDVISPEAQARYYARDPHNIIRLELGRDEPGDDELNNRYTRAATAFAEWRLDGVLRQDVPSLYVYQQEFSSGGQNYTRTSLVARVRLEPWEAGVVLPHERTLSKPKDDRLKLLRACAANLSPILALYDDPNGSLTAAMGQSTTHGQSPVAELTDEAGETHRLWAVSDAEFARNVLAFFRERQLYIADGHHRYETALTYRDETAELRKGLPHDDPANFTLMALSAIEDPGLLVLPTHRVLRTLDATRLADLRDALAPYFAVEPLDGADADAAVAALAGAGRETIAFVLATRQQTELLRLLPAGRAAMEQLAGAHARASDAWRRLDVAILHELVLNAALGISDEVVRAGEHISYTRDAGAALAAVAQGHDGAEVALLLNATPPAAIRDVARAGDRMPQKSTYFYPKLITGLVINPVW